MFSFLLTIYEILLLLAYRIHMYKDRITTRKRVGENRYKEIFGKNSIERPEGQLIWIHAISVGETMASLPVILALRQRHPDLNIMLTTGLMSSSNAMPNFLPPDANIIHQYIPIDSRKYVQSFYDHWKPDCVVFIESEIWPNILLESEKRGIPFILANARLSLASQKKWKKYPKIALRLMSCYSNILTQGIDGTNFFISIGCPAAKIHQVGPLKITSPKLRVHSESLEHWKRILLKRPVWLVASSHEGEEQILLNVHKQLLSSYPELLLIIAPRHVSRAHEIQELCVKFEMTSALHSLKEIPQRSTNVFIADTLGEMGLWYRLCKIVFLAGSLLPKYKGHNAFEPAQLGCCVLHGPYVSNCKKDYELLASFKCAQMIDDQHMLLPTLTSLMDENGFPNETSVKMTHNSAMVFAKRHEVLSNTIRIIESYIRDNNSNI